MTDNTIKKGRDKVAAILTVCISVMFLLSSCGVVDFSDTDAAAAETAGVVHEESGDAVSGKEASGAASAGAGNTASSGTGGTASGEASDAATEESGGAAFPYDWDVAPSLSYEKSLELDYARQFAVDYFEGGYALISISDGSRFLVVPENLSAPEGLEDGITVLNQPIENIYLAATATMDMFCALSALDHIAFSALAADGWYIDEAKDAMLAGGIAYAGKYSAPDYEKILESGCGLALESTMILHSPEVKENLEKLGIPVLVDYSSYEEHPLGRVEWVKLYGVLTGKEAEAEVAFEEQKDALAEAESDKGEKTGKTVAFFYITSNGAVSVRKSGDYVPRMIELAGGSYVFSGLGEGTNATSSVNMQMEEFYAGAKDADYLIYNGTFDDGLDSLQELLSKSPLFQDFKAVKEGHVYCTSKNLYQSSMDLGTVILDIHKMLTGEDAQDGFSYLSKLE